MFSPGSNSLYAIIPKHERPIRSGWYPQKCAKVFLTAGLPPDLKGVKGGQKISIGLSC